MNESAKPTLNRKLVRESCFGTYAISPESFKSYILTQTATEVVRIIDGKKTVPELIDLFGSSHRLDPEAARNQVNAVVDELRRIGALRLD